MAETTPVIEAQRLEVHFERGRFLTGRERVFAVNGVSLAIAAGETLGVAGESGSGKSTLGRALLGLVRPTAGEVRLNGRLLVSPERRPNRIERRLLQMVFQDPYGSLDPRQSVQAIIAEPLRIQRAASALQRQRVRELLEFVGLSQTFATRLPGQLSGGQRQRVGIARALACRPTFVVCDEPTSSLDVSVQAQIVNLLLRLQQETGVSYLFISHNLAVLKRVSNTVAILYLGKLVEFGPADDVLTQPHHPYTAALLSAVPVPDPRLERVRERIHLPGDPPSPINLPSGCPFHPRCARAQARCRTDDPQLAPVEVDQHLAACFYPITRDERRLAS
jgi:oligopeptide/dipeptide ABC transporter ATP-binding protein